ncbi:MAG: RHS repeat protein [Betaproteobacteria bacterium]|nr:RHS repeat protein [Betaproteobacteria bacterium]
MTQTTYPDGSTTRQTFDSLGRRTSVTNEEGQTTNFGYDGLGQRLRCRAMRGCKLRLRRSGQSGGAD